MINQVAKIAGVSRVTVWKVAKGRPGVSESTIKLVREAMQRVGYCPDRDSRRPGRPPGASTKEVGTGYVGLLLMGLPRALLQLPMMSELIAGIESALAEYASKLLVVKQVADPSRLPAKVSPDRLDGALVLGSTPQEIIPALQRLRSVCLMSPSESSGSLCLDRVQPDLEMVGQGAAEYLFGRGHQRLAFLCAASGHQGFRSMGRAFQAATQQKSVEPQMLIDGPTKQDVMWDVELGRPVIRSLVDDLLAANPRPTGIFVACDEMTVEVYHALSERGIRIGPKDAGGEIEIVSNNNEAIRLSTLRNSPPASFDECAWEIGACAVRRLLTRIEHPEEPPVRILVPPKLVEPKDRMETHRLVMQEVCAQ